MNSGVESFLPEHFTPHLLQHLPLDLPHRERLITIAGQHLARVAAANEYMNLTRITSPAEAAVKHVYDSTHPWRLFAEADRVLDAGTGAGFPGIPLSVLHPETRWLLSESIGKKARFVDAVADELELTNITVMPERAETVAISARPKLITARAVAPVAKLIDLFRKPIADGARLLLFKGPDVETELDAARESKVDAEIICRYELPAGLGSRTIVEVRKRKNR